MIEEIQVDLNGCDDLFSGLQDAFKLIHKNKNHPDELGRVIGEMRRFETPSNRHPYFTHHFPTNDGTLVTFKPDEKPNP